MNYEAVLFYKQQKDQQEGSTVSTDDITVDDTHSNMDVVCYIL